MVTFKERLIYDGVVDSGFWLVREVTLDIPRRRLIVGKIIFSERLCITNRTRAARACFVCGVIESPANARDMWQQIFAWFEEFSPTRREDGSMSVVGPLTVHVTVRAARVFAIGPDLVAAYLVGLI